MGRIGDVFGGAAAVADVVLPEEAKPVVKVLDAADKGFKLVKLISILG